MSKGRSNKLAGQIGEYLVCAELGRRGLIATPFSGNVPTFDVLATDEMCRTVPIQVKASRGNTWPSDARLWMKLEFDIQTKIQHYRGPLQIHNPALIYVCVSIAPPDSGRDRFFILTKTDLQTVCINVYGDWMSKHCWKRPRTPDSYDCRYNIAYLQAFENNWQLIETRLAQAIPDQSLEISEE